MLMISAYLCQVNGLSSSKKTPSIENYTVVQPARQSRVRLESTPVRIKYGHVNPNELQFVATDKMTG